MKITFVTPAPNLSGGLRVVAIYASLLRALGHEVVVVASSHRAPRWTAQLRALARGRWLKAPSKTSHYDRMQAELRLCEHAGPITDADVPDADAVIATWWETAFAVAALSPAKGRKFYFVQHHEVFGHVSRHLSAGSYYLPLRKITIAGWLRDVMAESYGDRDVALVPNSVDTQLFHAPPRGRQAVPIVGMMYSTRSFKGVDVALAAIARLRQTHPDVRVVAFGTEPPTRALPLPPGSRFFLLPDQDRLRDIYAMCDVFLAASRSEGFGLPILEAMACRCPVVATRTGCAGDVIRDGVNGVVADVEDPDGLARGLRQILDLAAPDWQRMSDAALASVQSYSWQDAAEMFEAALLESAHGNRRIGQHETTGVS
jgi:glycosyltransferase involved in cell wall biosynthesis